MKKKTIVYIAPHLSTGGMPQYLVKQIETIKEDVEVYCIEWDNVTGGVLVVQRNKMVNLLGDRLITLGEPREHLFTLLDRIKPEVVHLQEIPELFVPPNIADRLYNSNRTYVIIETSHDSSYNVQNKMFLPDKFLMVSQYQIDQYKVLGIPIDLVEYPIENKIRTKTRERALRDLGLDPNLKHVINVGLFTPRKNQAEVIEYARQLRHYPIQFHFIGNQADNFKHYWEPLMQNFPSNCKWWNERSDVDAFYEAADLFLFTSRGNAHDKETMPLVIREALSWKTPSMIYNLPVYMGYFDKFDSIEYLSENTQQNAYRIAERLFQYTPNLFDGSVNLSEQKVYYTPQNDVNSPEMSVDEYFDIRFFSEENKITFDYKKAHPFHTKISIKDKDSNAPIYWFAATFTEGSSYWCTPVPSAVFNFATEPSFEGFLVEFYNPIDNTLQLSKTLYVKDATNKRTIHLNIKNPFDCLFNNYNEMFVENKYDCYKLDNLDVVFDIGANNGLFSLLLLNKGAKKIYAFEPNQEPLVNLRHMFSGTDRVVAIEKAVYIEDKDLEFYIDPNNTTIGSVSEQHLLAGGSTTQKIIVPAISLKTFIKENAIDKVSLVKIDVEGAEYEIIENLEDEVYDIVDRFLIEFHDNSDKRVVKLVNTLKQKGYDIIQMRNQTSKENEDISSSYETSTVGTFLAVKRPVEKLLTAKPILIVDAFFHDAHCLTVLNDYLKQVKKLDIPIMLVTNSKFDPSLIGEMDYILYDSNNRLFKKKYKDIGHLVLYWITDNYYISLGTPAYQRHGLSVLSNLYHTTNLAKGLGYTHFYRIEYDCVLDNIDSIKSVISEVSLSNKKGMVHVNEDKYVSFQIWYFELEYFIKNFPEINTEDDYIKAVQSFNQTRDFISAEEFIYNMIKISDGGFSNVLAKSGESIHTNYGSCAWNTLTTSAESDKIVDGCVSTISRITITNDAIRAEQHKPRPDWGIAPEICPTDVSRVAFVTWNSSTSSTNHSTAKLTYPDGTTKIIEHNVSGMGNNQITVIDVVDGDIEIEIMLNGFTTSRFTVNTNTVSNLIDVYHPFTS